jgi:hypothetical protein
MHDTALTAALSLANNSVFSDFLQLLYAKQSPTLFPRYQRCIKLLAVDLFHGSWQSFRCVQQCGVRYERVAEYFPNTVKDSLG